MSVFDAQRLDFPCPHCGHKLSETVAKLKTNPKLTCRACRTVIDVNATDLRQKVATAEKALADLSRKISRLGK